MNDPIPRPAVTGLLQQIPDEPGPLSARRASGRTEARRRWRALYPEKKRAERRRYRQNLRFRVFRHYGTTCACCGTADRLTIDHVRGNGAEHRAELGARGVGLHFYRWLAANGFPPGFQSLCEPCNQSKGRGPACRIDHDSEQDGPGDDAAARSLIAC